MQFWDRLCVQVLVGTFSLVLAGCHNDGSRVGPLAEPLLERAATISGSVGDGPVAGASLELRDRTGDIVANGLSDAHARFEIVVPEQTLYPITLRSIGGTDLVTGRAPDVPLELLIADPSQFIGNLSPLSTFAARVALCTNAKPDQAQLDAAWVRVLDRLNMGFDAEQFGNPATTPMTPGNVTDLVFASEGLAEAIRRATAALASSSSLSTEALIDVLACDLGADALIDGRGGVAASERVAAVFRAASAAVLLEMGAKQLRVDGVDAMAALDLAIARAMPNAGTIVSASDVAASAVLIRQTRDALAIFYIAFDDDPIGRYVTLLDQTPIGELKNAIRLEAAAPGSIEMAGFPDRVAFADDGTVAHAMTVARVQHEASPPLVSFASVPAQVRPGAAARLSWASTQATRCHASGGWSGRQAAAGTLMTAPVDRPITYRLDCTGLGGTATAQLTVGLAGEVPRPLPRVDLAVTADSVPSGGDVTLSWNSTDTRACMASDAWSGSKSSSGTETAVPVATSRYVLTCTGAGGTATDQVIVSVSVPEIVRPPSPTNPTEPPAGQPPEQPAAPQPVVVPTPPAAVTATLAASPEWVTPGGSTQLRWTSSGADGCAASGSWSGNKDTAGAVSAGPIARDASFSLRCTGPGGHAIVSTTVSTRTARLSWQPPAWPGTGSSLAGYRIYTGNVSGSYGPPIRVNDTAVLTYTMTLAPGTHYFVMSALDASGNESPKSNEVSKTIN